MTNPSPEYGANGPLQLMIGDQAFTVSQRLIMLGAKKTDELGVLPKDIPGFPPLVLKGATAINTMLNSKAAEAKVDSSSMNAFFFELGKFDSVFLRVSLKSGSRNGDLMEMLQFPSGSGSEFVKALQSLDKPTAQELVGETLRIRRDQKIDDSNIVADNLVIFPQSTTALADSVLKNPASVPSLYEQNKSRMIVHKVPLARETQADAEDDVDLSEFVPQTAFFRDEPTFTDLTQTHEPDKTKEPEQKKMTTEQPEQKSQIFVHKAEKVETEDEEALQKIADSITERVVFGKFEKPVIIQGLNSPGKVSEGRSADFNFYTEKGNTSRTKFFGSFDPTGHSYYFWSYLSEQRGSEPGSYGYKIPEGLALKSSLIFANLPDLQNDNFAKLMVVVPVSDRDYSHRDVTNTQIFCTLPKDELAKLLSITRDNPVNAERFVQVAFDGIDNISNRRPVDVVSLVDVTSFLPLGQDYGQCLVGEGNWSHIYYKTKISDYNANAVTTLHYPQPLPKFQLL